MLHLTCATGVAKYHFRINKEFIESGSCCVSYLGQWTGFKGAVPVALVMPRREPEKSQVVYHNRCISTKKGKGTGPIHYIRK
jgi:hypothetical protein